MNKIESLVYNLVKSNPHAKMQIRDAYQRLLDFIPVKRTASAYGVKARKGYFFGFHDKCPWSGDDSMLLAHRFNIPLRMPGPEDTVEVGYFQGPGYTSFVPVGVTKAWNWHQGAMLQWVGKSSHILFNDFDGQGHIARMIDSSGNKVATFQFPIAAVSADGKLALSYSFVRSRVTPFGYGYANSHDENLDSRASTHDGLTLLSLESGQAKFLFSVADIAAIQSAPSMRGAFHYFSHCQFSPSARRFKFFHRWVKPNSQQRTRMISCDANGNNIYIFPTDEMVSHVAWQDDEHILAYARTKEFGNKYHMFWDMHDEFKVVGQNVFSSDGHPSFSRDGRWILTDTYADRFRRRYLILYDIQRQKRYNLAVFYSPREYAGNLITGAIRCDLHPRWSRDNTMICFDSAHTGKRALCTIKLGNLVHDGGEPLAII
jgi:hypothetical protein